MPTWFLSFPVSKIPAGDLEKMIPAVFLQSGYTRKGMHFIFPTGKMTFEFVDEDVFVFVTDLEGVRPEWREQFESMPDVTVWNAFSLRRNEVMWRPHHAAVRERREEVAEPRRGQWIIGSFSYTDFLWLESGDFF